MALLNSNELTAKITKIARSANELETDIQLAAVNAVGYSIQHGDITFGQKLFDALPKGIRRQSLVAFLEKHGQFAWLKEDKKFAYYKVDGIQFDEITLLATPWSSASKEVIVSEYDFEKMFDSLMKKMESVYKKHESVGVKIKNSNIYDYLARARDEINSDKFAIVE